MWFEEAKTRRCDPSRAWLVLGRPAPGRLPLTQRGW